MRRRKASCGGRCRWVAGWRARRGSSGRGSTSCAAASPCSCAGRTSNSTNWLGCVVCMGQARPGPTAQLVRFLCFALLLSERWGSDPLLPYRQAGHPARRVCACACFVLLVLGSLVVLLKKEEEQGMSFAIGPSSRSCSIIDHTVYILSTQHQLWSCINPASCMWPAGLL